MCWRAVLLSRPERNLPLPSRFNHHGNINAGGPDPLRKEGRMTQESWSGCPRRTLIQSCTEV